MGFSLCTLSREGILGIYYSDEPGQACTGCTVDNVSVNKTTVSLCLISANPVLMKSRAPGTFEPGTQIKIEADKQDTGRERWSRDTHVLTAGDPGTLGDLDLIYLT